jgi:hypothetical protein
MKYELANDARSRQRFVDEAKVGARIESEHVVEVIAEVSARAWESFPGSVVRLSWMTRIR